MRISELRIRNYYIDEFGFDAVVDLDTFRRLCECIIEESDISQIQLTEEWLLKLGFREIKRRTHEFEEIFYGKSIIKDSPDHLEMLVVAMPFNNCHVGEFLIEEDYLMNIHVNYVHQLQNLYFALTNEELTI